MCVCKHSMETSLMVSTRCVWNTYNKSPVVLALTCHSSQPRWRPHRSNFHERALKHVPATVTGINILKYLCIF